MTLKRRHISLILLGLLLLPITLQSPFAHSADSTYVATPPRDAGGNALPGYIGVDSKPSEQLLIFPSFLINLIGKKAPQPRLTLVHQLMIRSAREAI